MDTTALILIVMAGLGFALLILFLLTRILLRGGRAKVETPAITKDRAYNALNFTQKIIERSNLRAEVRAECEEKLRSARNAYERGQYTIAIEITDEIKSIIRRNMGGNRNSR